MNLEQRVEQLEKQGKRLQLAVLVLAVALCGVVTMAAKVATVDAVEVRGTVGYFAQIETNALYILDHKDETVALLTADRTGGYLGIYNNKDERGREIVNITADDYGNGIVNVYNKTRETIVTLGADEYGNGEVGVWNRKGKGRVYDSK
jgi:hypothetical protein|tara:strand:- start:5430 stop:5873 length:444 start_codon:yes stop_codon:yes gene_type:complete